MGQGSGVGDKGSGVGDQGSGVGEAVIDDSVLSTRYSVFSGD